MKRTLVIVFWIAVWYLSMSWFLGDITSWLLGRENTWRFTIHVVLMTAASIELTRYIVIWSTKE